MIVQDIEIRERFLGESIKTLSFKGDLMFFHSTNDNRIWVSDDNFKVKTLQSEKEKYSAYRLRKEIFCNELCWVDNTNQEYEIDDYDKRAILFGAINKHHDLIGTVRIIPAQYTMMVENEFVSLIEPSHQIKKGNNTAEISRLAVPKSVHPVKRAAVSHALYKAIYIWSLSRKVRYLYFVVQIKMMRNLLLAGFPCRQIGPVRTMPGGCDSLAALLDWQQLGNNFIRRFSNDLNADNN